MTEQIHTEILQEMVGLTDSERLDARNRAREYVIRAQGDKPTRAQFEHHTASRYPRSISALIVGLCLVALLAAFTPSAIRLYHIGSQTFGATIADSASARLVGVATVLLAETGQLIFSLGLAALGASAAARRLLYASMFISTLIALVGNIQVALPGHWANPFAWLEAIAPPVLVLSTAYVLKELLLHAIEQRHANEQAYQAALQEWKSATANPEQSALWSQAYANALRAALESKNRRYKRGRAALDAGLTADTWRALVYRELKADSWYADPITAPSSGYNSGEVRADFFAEPPAPTAVNSNGVGH